MPWGVRTARWDVLKDITVRSKGGWGGTREGAPERETLTIGKKGGYTHRTFMKFAMDQSDIGILRKAELVLHMVDDEYGIGQKAKVRGHRLLKGFIDRTGADWQKDAAINPKVATGRVVYGRYFDRNPGDEVRIDITPLVGPMLTKQRRWQDGGVRKTGRNADNKGLSLRGVESGTDLWQYGWQAASGEHPNVALRPYIDITYVPPNYPPDLIGAISPTGTVFPDQPFIGEFADPNGDAPRYIRVVVRRKGDGREVWYSTKVSFDQQWPNNGGVYQWTVENPGSRRLKSNVDYEWRARGWDRAGQATDWTPWTEFRQEGTAPSVSLVTPPTLPTLQHFEFAGNWTVEAGERLTSYRVQVRYQNDAWETPQWDATFSPLTQRERDLEQIRFEYGGPNLPAGTYDVRVRVTDSRGVSSLWDETSFTLTEGSEDLGVDADFLPPYRSGYARKRPPARIILYDVDGPGRGPGTIKAVIEDAHNIGMSAVVNEPGEFFFTLTALHPQASECEPFQRHYALQQYRNGSWVDIANGLLTDFDAGDNDIVIYGLDYIGLLARTVDTRFPGKKLHADHASGGAKYRDKRIDEIVVEQLEQARIAPDSQIGFIEQGVINQLDTKVSIWSSFKARGAFIRGLLESHRAGTGRRTRLKPRYDRSQSRWEWDLRDTPGADRNSLRMSYGSLLQNFRVIAMGEDHATRVNAVGTRVNSVKPRYYMWPEEGGTDFLTNTFGNLQRVEIWDDIADVNDLKRRTRQLRSEASKVGKRIRLAIRVHGVLPFDGYDLTDNFPLDIDRGIVETAQYGSGYWTILGLEYRIFPDGHDELTWAIKPREDDTPPSADLLPSDPMTDWPTTVTPNDVEYVQLAGAPLPWGTIKTDYYAATEDEYIGSSDGNGHITDIGSSPGVASLAHTQRPEWSSCDGLDNTIYQAADQGIIHGPITMPTPPAGAVAYRYVPEGQYTSTSYAIGKVLDLYIAYSNPSRVMTDEGRYVGSVTLGDHPVWEWFKLTYRIPLFMLPPVGEDFWLILRPGTLAPHGTHLCGFDWPEALPDSGFWEWGAHGLGTSDTFYFGAFWDGYSPSGPSPEDDGVQFYDWPIGVGDGVTDTLTGFRTAPGTALWYIDGILVRPKSVDESTGVVVFDRPIPYMALVTQSGTGRIA